MVGPASAAGKGSYPDSNGRGAQLRIGPCAGAGGARARGLSYQVFQVLTASPLGHPLLRESYINNRRNVQTYAARTLKVAGLGSPWGLARASAQVKTVKSCDSGCVASVSLRELHLRF